MPWQQTLDFSIQKLEKFLKESQRPRAKADKTVEYIVLDVLDDEPLLDFENVRFLYLNLRDRYSFPDEKYFSKTALCKRHGTDFQHFMSDERSAGNELYDGHLEPQGVKVIVVLFIYLLFYIFVAAF